jgi:hypothetical protein
MNRFHSNILWQGILLFLSTLILIKFINCCKYSEILKEILIGIISAVLLLLFIEIRDLIIDRIRYGILKGKYKRVEIYNVNHKATENTKYESLQMRYSNVNSIIGLKYLGEREYCFEADYEEGSIKAIIHINQTDNKQGIGHYQYVKKEPNKIMPDLGTFHLQVDTLNANKLYIFHNNLIPSGLAEGYEVWVKK